jgi:hypothetical protein
VISRNAGQYKLLEGRLSDGECYAIAIPQGDNSLLEISDAVIRDFMKSQKAQQWKTSYEEETGQKVLDPVKRARALVINEAKEIETQESTGQIPKAPVGSVLRRIQDRGYLVVGVREDLPDLGTRDLEIDKLSWLEVELSQALATRIFGDANKVRYRKLNVEKRISAMKIWPDLFANILKNWTILSTIIMTDWWYLGMKGKLDPYLCPAKSKETLDFVGLDYYWGGTQLGSRAYFALKRCCRSTI